MSAQKANHYEILGVARVATAEEIRAAFRRLAYLHPDQHPTDPTATERFARITAAYAILSDPALRARYDRMPTDGAPGQVTDAVNFVVEVIEGAKGVDPKRAALGVLDRMATEEGRRELRDAWSGLRTLLR